MVATLSLSFHTMFFQFFFFGSSSAVVDEVGTDGEFIGEDFESQAILIELVKINVVLWMFIFPFLYILFAFIALNCFYILFLLFL